MGVDDVQGGGALCQERRWEAGDTTRCYDYKQLLMGGGRMEEGTEKNP